MAEPQGNMFHNGALLSKMYVVFCLPTTHEEHVVFASHGSDVPPRRNHYPDKKACLITLVLKEKGQLQDVNVGVSKNRGTPKSSILIGFSIINHPFRATPIFGKTHVAVIVTS